MSTPVLPLVIRGSGCVTLNGFAYYWKDALTIKPVRKTFTVESDYAGPLDDRVTSLMVDIEFTPVGMMTSLVKFYPYGPSNLVSALSVGSSIFGGPGVNNPATIATKAGQTIAYNRAGIYKSPTLYLSPNKTAFGPMTIRAIGKSGVLPTDAAYLKTIASTAFSDTSFDPTKIVTDIYSASLGSRSSPYNAMGARSGFEIEPVYSMEDVPDDGIGIADTTLTGVRWKCRFAPNNLTEAQVDALANWQGTSAIIPGQSVSRDNESLIMNADVMTASLFNVGVISGEHGVGVKKDRNGMIEFITKQTFTAGVAQPQVSLLLN